MALFKFFKAFFNQGKRKTAKQKPFRRAVKTAKKARNQSRLKPAKRITKKTRHKLRKRINKRLHKPARKKKKTPKQLKIKTAPKEKEIGVITHYFDKISVGIIKLKAPLAISEHIHIKGKSTDFTQVISSMQYNHQDITLAKAGLEIGVKITQPVRENDLVYKVI